MCTHVFHMLLHVYYRLCRFRFLCMAYYMYIVCEWFRYDLKVTIGVCTFCVRRRYMYAYFTSRLRVLTVLHLYVNQ